jgi:hypothetical protein
MIERSAALSEQFQQAVRAEADKRPELLPTHLVTICARLLPADGVGLSVLSGELRVPLGASGDAATAAERLQVVVGEGPCMQALHDHSEIRADDRDMARRWPLFYDELHRQTPFRSIASLPLQVTPDLTGAIDLYFHDTTGAYLVNLSSAEQLAEAIVHTLRSTTEPAVPSATEPEVSVPAWLYSPTARDRLRIWIGAGVLMAHFQVAATDALIRLRAYAYANEQGLGDVSDAIISGDLPANEFQLHL